MVLKILSDTRQVVDGLDAEPAQALAVPDPRELEDLGRVDRAAAQDHLPRGADRLALAVLRVLHPDCPLPLEQDPGGERLGQDGEVPA